MQSLSEQTPGAGDARKSVNKGRLQLLGVLVVLGVFAGACKEQTKRQEPPPVYRDDYLTGFLDEFLSDAQTHGAPVANASVDKLRVLMFVDDIADQKRTYGQEAAAGEDLAGACTDVEVDNSVGMKPFRWKVDKTSWQEIWISRTIMQGRDKPTPKIVMRELMYHELGHCLFGLDHAPDSPHAIMSPQVRDDAAWLERNWQRLIKDFFAQAAAS